MIVLYIEISVAIRLVVFAIKNDVTFRNQTVISTAVHLYRLQTIHDPVARLDPLGIRFEVDYDDIEDYDKTLFRLWDWGYTRILPPEKYEIIKPYIRKGGER